VSRLDWLLSETPSDFTVPPGTVFQADDDNWRASIERIPLTQSLQVFLNDIVARRDFRAEPMVMHATPYLVGQVALEGRLDLDLGNGQVARATTQSAVLYRPVARAVHGFQADVRYRSVGYSMSLRRVERLLEGEVPPSLRSLLDGEPPPTRYVATRNRGVMRRLAGAAFGRSLNGPLRRLMVEGAVLQLFATQAAAAAPPAPPADNLLSRRERSLMGEALDRLLADMRRPPSLGELAESTGLSERRLNACFRRAFGATVFETLRNHRLEHGRLALEAGAPSLKEIAWRVGYNDVSNFIHAFCARYGAPPRRYMEKTSTQ
jgi:AraC-like DNA-binding protein